MCDVVEEYATERENMVYNILELIKDGLTDSEIINRLGCSMEQIQRARLFLSK